MTGATHAVSRHDLSLAGIAVVLVAGFVVAQLSSLGLSRTLFAASLPAAACIYWVLFHSPPTEKNRS